MNETTGEGKFDQIPIGDEFGMRHYCDLCKDGDHSLHSTGRCTNLTAHWEGCDCIGNTKPEWKMSDEVAQYPEPESKPNRQENVGVYQMGLNCWWSCTNCGVASVATGNLEKVERWADHHRCA